MYNDVVHKKVDEKFTKCFIDSPDIVANMKNSKKAKATVITCGLWPLDVISHSDWRQSTHAGKTYAEWVSMARMEIQLVQTYRATLLRQCPAALFIRIGLAKALEEACNITPWEVKDETTGTTVKKHVRRFVYADKVPSEGTTISQAPKVNVVELKESREREARSQSLAKEAGALLKKIEHFKGSSAAPGSRKIDEGVSQAIRRLRAVSSLFLLPSTIYHFYLS